MPVPPAFVPPGLNRVPTPPLLDANGEVVGKLADFFFDIQGVRTHKPPQTPGSIWDSDALLMSQETNISPPTSNSDESPQGLSVTPLAHDDPKSTQPAAPAAGYLTVITPPSAAPPVPDFAQDWFRVQKNTEPPFSSARKDSMAREAEARAKLEWLVPEHLPTSPLCPLNSKYRGSGKGICPYHGARKKSLAASRMSVGSVGGKRLDGRRVSEIMDGVDEGLGSSGRWRRVCAASSP
ncbi:hypothetical protein BU26DRAFT_523832 [Trematosphaeria pertusa]|uniref:Uncharacterized protein n=1 Tax=Trematosphaeria pertusa TaxID=390896 RepID=A0A6A6HYG8_9PLEO|nr:uncharacterized protein BU26DRAFT_523832 [Trematosphaeria pertusa]KAF2242828.1 hypothetical protein BU26DRAFT_523832 [Trematosphaeria pertusa]